jgi:hypothetical protein
VGQEHEHQMTFCSRAQNGSETRTSDSVVQKGTEWARNTNIRKRCAEGHRVGNEHEHQITFYRRAQNGPETRTSDSVVQKGTEWAINTSIR